MWLPSCFQRRTATPVSKRSKPSRRPAPRGGHATPPLQVEQLEQRWCPSYSLVTSRTALAGTDSVSWPTPAPSSGYNYIANPFTILSTAGRSITVSKTPADNFASVVQDSNPPGTLANGSWVGNFAPGDVVLWTNDALDSSRNPITLNFGTTAVAAGGAQIDVDIAVGSSINFTAEVGAYDANGNTLASFTEKGVATTAEDNSAIFIGISSSSANISQIALSIKDVAKYNKGDFAINKFDFRTSPLAAATPAAAPAVGQRASALDLAPLAFSLLGSEQQEGPFAMLAWPAPLAARQSGAGIAPLATATATASHLPATDAVFAAAGQAASDDDAWLFGSLSGRNVDGI